MRIEFFVHGRLWRQDIASIAQSEMVNQGDELYLGAVRVQCEFSFSRPKSAQNKIMHKTTRPDCDNLIRAVLDGLKEIVYYDDAQVVSIVASKVFAEPEGAWIVVESLDTSAAMC